MGTVIVNDVEVEAEPHENLVQVARHAGVEIPHYCWHPDLSVVASCRMCLVEVGEKKPDGTTVMLPKLMPACQVPAKPGTVVRTDTAKVKSTQAQTLEFLLLNHPLDCSICDQAGECYLQDYSYKYGRAESRLHEPKVQRIDKYHIGDQIALFTDRCVMCTRCVRFTREISGTGELYVADRGSVSEIEVFPGEPCNNKLAGNVVDLCPVGALCSKDFLYKKRVWWLKSQSSVCTGCSTGCSIHVDQHEGKIFRLRPRENPQAQGSFMCDEGRFGWKYIHDDQRLVAPRVGMLPEQPTPRADHSNGRELVRNDPWPAALQVAREAIAAAVAADARRCVAVLSPMMACEEAFLLCKYMHSLDRRVQLALGPVPVDGQDDSYPKGLRGRPPAPGKEKFTIRAEKCPNRFGVELLLRHFQGAIISFESIAERIRHGDVKFAYFVGGYSGAWLDEESLKLVCSVPSLVVQDILRSELSDKATVVLAAASFAEREGTVVNYAGLAQLLRPAIRPPGEARSDGRLLMELSERKGLYNSRQIRREMARDIPAFAAFSSGEIGDLGLKLTQPQLAMV